MSFDPILPLQISGACEFGVGGEWRWGRGRPWVGVEKVDFWRLCAWVREVCDQIWLCTRVVHGEESRGACDFCWWPRSWLSTVQNWLLVPRNWANSSGIGIIWPNPKIPRPILVRLCTARICRGPPFRSKIGSERVKKKWRGVWDQDFPVDWRGKNFSQHYNFVDFCCFGPVLAIIFVFSMRDWA